MSLTELIVTAFLMSFSMAAIGELVYLNTYASTKLTNKVDGQVGCSRAIRRIAADVRAARIIGNVYAQYGNQSLFPDSSSGTDVFAQIVPPVVWPSAPWPTAPYRLGPQALILQLPVYFNDATNSADPSNGIPLLLPKGSIVSSPIVPPVSVEWVDTIVYQLVADPVNVGTYDLQVARFTVAPPPTFASGGVTLPQQNLRVMINPPQTILTGITGPLNPLDGTNKPAIFQYLTSPSATTTVIQPTGIPPVVGVSINIQAQAPPSGFGTNVQQSASHVEAYIRSAGNLRMTSN